MEKSGHWRTKMEILNKIPLTNPICNNYLILSFLMGFACIGILGMIFGAAPFGTIRDKISTFIMWISIIGLIGGIIWLTINSIVPGEPNGRYRYEVKISDSITFKEVTDNYKIIKNRGEIWILEDKDD